MFRAPDTEPTTRRNPQRPMRNVLVTGGCGFIGSNFINYFMKQHPEVHIYNIDNMSYCANMKNIEQPDSPNYTFVLGDITNRDLVSYVLSTCDIDTIINFAAQSHVENSFGNSVLFTMSNVVGTHVLLECARVHNKIEKFVHVSTDEVYGEVDSAQMEGGTVNPTNPYAATKAAAEYIAKSYYTSFGIPVVITRGNNVYGIYQYPEKVIPRFAMLAHLGQKLTIQGNGSNTRMFMHATDVARAFATILERGFIGEIYNIGTRDEYSVLDVARMTIAQLFGEEAVKGDRLNNYITFVKDRNFNDQRYDIDSSKLEALGWRQEIDFKTGFRDTVDWYVKAIDEDFWVDIRVTLPTSSPDASINFHTVPVNH